MGIYVISKEDMNERCRCDRLSIVFQKWRWRWLGHVLRMPDNNIVLQPKQGKRKEEGSQEPKNNMAKNNGKGEAREAGLKYWNEVHVLAKDKSKWRISVEALCVK